MLLKRRKFEMVSSEQIKKSFGEDSEWINESFRGGFKLRFEPRRATKNSAAYDLYSTMNLTLKPGEIAKIPTGFKIKMPKNEAFFIYSRSSLGSKDISLPGGVSIIDADYYNNVDNEGNFFIVIKNNSKKNFEIKQGDRIAQGVFQRYYKTSDDKVKKTRKGGFGSSGF